MRKARAEWLHCLHCLARRLQGRTSPLGPISMASPNICRHTFPQGMGDLEWKGPKGRAVLDAVVSNRRSGEKDRLDGNINWKICEILLSLCYTFSTWAMLPDAKSSTLAMWLLQLPQFGRAKTHVVTLAIKLPDVVHLLWLTEVVVLRQRVNVTIQTAHQLKLPLEVATGGANKPGQNDRPAGWLFVWCWVAIGKYLCFKISAKIGWISWSHNCNPVCDWCPTKIYQACSNILTNNSAAIHYLSSYGEIVSQ